jgi:hypothetical protein
MAKYRILYWHGIPTQVRSQDKSGRVSKKLPDRFMEAVDKAAMIAKHTDGDLYSEGFQWGDWEERDGSAEEVGKAIVAELDEQNPEIDFRAVAQRLKEE